MALNLLLISERSSGKAGGVQPIQAKLQHNPNPTQIQPKSNPNPTQIQPESSPNPAQIQPESSPNPAQIRPKSGPQPVSSPSDFTACSSALVCATNRALPCPFCETAAASRVFQNLFRVRPGLPGWRCRAAAKRPANAGKTHNAPCGPFRKARARPHGQTPGRFRMGFSSPLL